MFDNPVLTVLYCFDVVWLLSFVVLALSRYFVLKPMYDWYDFFFYSPVHTFVTMLMFCGSFSMQLGVFYDNKNTMAAGFAMLFIGAFAVSIMVVINSVLSVVPYLNKYHKELLKKRG